MSFSFGFADDDIDAPEAPKASVTNPLDEVRGGDPPTIVSFEAVLKSLTGTRVSFDNYRTPQDNLVYRRELFDVKHQVMSEDSELSVGSILLGDEKDVDLKQNVYEGGFKSWECSYDTVDFVARLMDLSAAPNVLELGCGTALPSCFLLRKYLEALAETESPLKPASFTLTDFNYDVLRLVTVPNLVVHWASTLPPQQLHQLCTSDDGAPLRNDELVISAPLCTALLQDLAQKNISISLVSGAWSRSFLEIVGKNAPHLLITSETIYSPQSLPLVAEIILGLLAPSSACKRALVAAKSIYFGVGGSVAEFVNYINTHERLRVSISQSTIGEAQLKRLVLDISVGIDQHQ